MSGVQTTLALQDRLTGPLIKMMKAMDRTIDVMQRMDQASNKVDMKSLTKARSTIQSASADLERLVSSSSSAGAGLAPLNRSFVNLPGPINTATNAVRNFFAGFAGATAAYLSIQGIANGVKSFVTAADTYVSTNARLGLINDKLQTQAELQQKVYQAAQRSRTGYNDLAGSVAKLNLLAADSFSGNDEAIRFSELMGKAFTVSGASTQEREAGMYQLTQAMAAGKLQGDEFRSIMENAPLLAQAIADATGKSKGELKDMSAKGTITADIIKSALFKAADDIENKFKNMPMTFAQGWTMFKNWSLMAFEPLFVRFNQFVNSDAFGVLAGHAMWFVNVFIAGMGLMFDALEWIYGAIGAVGQFFEDNWSWIAPILTVIAAVLGTLSIILLWLGVKWLVVKSAIAIATAAQWAFNTAMGAFPGTWILLGFVAVIAIVIYALYAWGDQTASVVGAIVGAFYWLGAASYNVLMGIGNFGIIVAEWFVNTWNKGVYDVQLAFYGMQSITLKVMETIAKTTEGVVNSSLNGISDLVNTAISGLNKLIDIANKIPKVNISHVGTVDFQVKNSLSSRIGSLRSKLEKPSLKDPVTFDRLAYKDTGAAFDKGNRVGQNLSNLASNGIEKLVDKTKNMFKGLDGKDKNPNPFTEPPGMNQLNANPTGGKLDKIGKIDDEINIAEEDLKVLRELAERKSIQNIITLTPTVQFTGDNYIREEADIDKIIEKVETKWVNEASESAEGDYS